MSKGLDDNFKTFCKRRHQQPSCRIPRGLKDKVTGICHPSADNDLSEVQYVKIVNNDESQFLPALSEDFDRQFVALFGRMVDIDRLQLVAVSVAADIERVLCILKDGDTSVRVEK